jgi:hypothetical protein
LIVLPLSLFHLKNRIYLSHGVQVTGVVWRAAIRIITGVEDMMQRIRDGHTCQVLDGRVIVRSGGAVCGLHHARGDEKCEFLG